MSSHSSSEVIVHVDAKIVGMHDKNLPKKAFVAYVVIDTNLKGYEVVDATETDDAEIEAIRFAIEKLRSKFDSLTIICDHESVVSEANKKLEVSTNSRLNNLRKLLSENGSVKLKPLGKNHAHQVLTEFVNELKKREENLGPES